MKPLFAAALAALLIAPAAVRAHPGHDHKVLGIVTAVHENHLEVKDAKGKLSMHVLGPTTKIRRDKTTVTAADIKVGDRVVVTTRQTKDKAGKAVFTVVDVQIVVAATATKASVKK